MYQIQVHLNFLRDEFNLFKSDDKNQKSKFVLKAEHKKQMADMQVMLQDEMSEQLKRLMKLEDMLDDFDFKIKRNVYEMENLMKEFKVEKQQVEGTVKYANLSIDQMIQNNKSF